MCMYQGGGAARRDGSPQGLTTGRAVQEGASRGGENEYTPTGREAKAGAGTEGAARDRRVRVSAGRFPTSEIGSRGGWTRRGPRGELLAGRRGHSEYKLQAPHRFEIAGVDLIHVGGSPLGCRGTATATAVTHSGQHPRFHAEPKWKPSCGSVPDISRRECSVGGV